MSSPTEQINGKMWRYLRRCAERHSRRAKANHGGVSCYSLVRPYLRRSARRLTCGCTLRLGMAVIVKAIKWQTLPLDLSRTIRPKKREKPLSQQGRNA